MKHIHLFEKWNWWKSGEEKREIVTGPAKGFEDPTNEKSFYSSSNSDLALGMRGTIPRILNIDDYYYTTRTYGGSDLVYNELLWVVEGLLKFKTIKRKGSFSIGWRYVTIWEIPTEGAPIYFQSKMSDEHRFGSSVFVWIPKEIYEKHFTSEEALRTYIKTLEEFKENLEGADEWGLLG